MMSSKEYFAMALDLYRLKAFSSDKIKELADRIGLKDCMDLMMEVFKELPDELIKGNFRHVIFCCFCKYWDRNSYLGSEGGEDSVRKCVVDPKNPVYTDAGYFCGEAEDDLGDVMCDMAEEDLVDGIL